jgi:hypothetical protein
VSDGGKPCGRKVGTLDKSGFPDEWFRNGNYDRLTDEERHYHCPKHDALQIHEEDLLRRALNPGRRRLTAMPPGERPGDR